MIFDSNSYLLVPSCNMTCTYDDTGILFFLFMLGTGRLANFLLPLPRKSWANLRPSIFLLIQHSNNNILQVSYPSVPPCNVFMVGDEIKCFHGDVSYVYSSVWEQHVYRFWRGKHSLPPCSLHSSDVISHRY